MNLPEIIPNSVRQQAGLAGKIENLLQSCESIESKSLDFEDILTKFRYFQRSSESIKRTIRPHEIGKKSRVVEDYVMEKYRSNEVPVREIMSSRNVRLNLSFDGYENSEVFKDLSRQKRKFGKTWDDVHISSSFNEYTCKDPTLNKSPKTDNINIMQGSKRHNVLSKVIQNFMSKKLGLIYKVNVEKEKKEDKRFKSDRFVKRNNIQLKKIMTRARHSIYGNASDQDEREYLAPEFKACTKDTGNKLKLEKIMVEQHLKVRKLQINGGMHMVR